MEHFLPEIIENSREAAKWSAFYDERWHLEWLGIGHFHRVRAAQIEGAVREYVKKVSYVKILDIGCGTGWLCLFLSKYGHYVGVDFSPKSIAYARCVYGDRGTFLLANPEDPFLGLRQEVPFDVVVASEVIEHVKNHRAFVAQLDLFTKPGGIVILTTPNGYLYSIFTRKYATEMQPIENWLTPPQLEELLLESGLQVIQHTGILYRKPVYGLRAYLISKWMRRLFTAVGLEVCYQRILLRNSIYQFIVSSKPFP